MQEPFDAERRFNDRAPCYDTDIDKIIPGYRALHDGALHLLKTSIPVNAKVLVAGSGTGNEAIGFAQENPGWSIHGFDIARGMVDVARDKTARLWLQSRVSFTHGRASDVFEDSFDAAVSILVMHFLKGGEKADFLYELWLRLRPGGVLILADITGDRNAPVFETLLRAWESFQLRRLEPDDVEKRIAFIRDGLPVISRRETETLLDTTGFTNVRLFHKSLLIEGTISEKTV